MNPFRNLDRFSPSEGYLLTLLAAHHLELIREEQLLTYLDRGMGVANRDARTALLESALLRSDEIEELDRYLERKLERGPREFPGLCRSMFTPSAERVLRTTRNDDARRLTLDSRTGIPVAVAAGSGGNGSSIVDESEWEEDPEGKAKPQSHPWIKAAIAIGVLILVGMAYVMPMDKPFGMIQQQKPQRTAEAYWPQADDMQAVVRVLFLILSDQDAVIAQLTKDPNLTEKQRKEALEIAKDRPDNALLLNNSPWYVVRYAASSKKGYERCLDLALEAVRLSPHEGMFVNTLGVAQYRVGQYKEAVETLNKSYAMNQNSFVGEQPADVAFLCMSYARLGRAQEAKEQFALLMQLTKQKRWQEDLESVAFCKEAAEVMRQAHIAVPVN
ncbi:MAG TPA: hypothetical protein VGP68_10850 [Gemmataceae bacterium]|jgi:tetratricopeptide (TPR) repeat protein|nr:hypothetical protein [Gemmataceae bacterium]